MSPEGGAASGALWRVAGTYLESCNCEAICPCRRIDGVPGGRSTFGICEGALSWQILEGSAGEVDLSGLAVVLASRYSDDEEGSPWTFVLYVDERGSDEQRRVLEEIWTGRAQGGQVEHFPWAWKASNLVAVTPAEIEIDHTPRRQWFRVRDAVSVRISGPADQGTVTCVIPGHHQQGEEVIAEELTVNDGPLQFAYQGKCGYAASFDYSSG
jgi:hypothetical protein